MAAICGHGNISFHQCCNFSCSASLQGVVWHAALELVSSPDPTLSRGKGSGDHWAISWLCRVSSLDTEQPNEIVLRHATMCSIDWPTFRSLVPRPHPCRCCATQVTWLMDFADSAQPRNRSMVTRPFSSWEGGVSERDYSRVALFLDLFFFNSSVLHSIYYIPLPCDRLNTNNIMITC